MNIRNEEYCIVFNNIVFELFLFKCDEYGNCLGNRDYINTTYYLRKYSLEYGCGPDYDGFYT